MNLGMLLISAALAQEPAQLDPTDGLLFSIFVGFGSGHFYAHKSGAGAAFLLTQAAATAGMVAIEVNVSNGISLEEAIELRNGAIVCGVLLAGSRTIEIATVLPAVRSYNEGGWKVRKYSAPLSEDYDGADDHRYTGDRPTTMGQPARSRPVVDPESAMAWKLTSIAYSKLDRQPDAEEALVHSLIEGLLDDGYLPSTIVAAVDLGSEAVPDKAAAGVCEIIRAGLFQAR